MEKLSKDQQTPIKDGYSPYTLRRQVEFDFAPLPGAWCGGIPSKAAIFGYTTRAPEHGRY